jgi:hypothetical protein|tara:strand:+ start:124 stop:765 length:642 start_codon:yes stop_codon:yes gene_type:complete
MALVTAMVMVTAMANKEAGVTKVKVDAVYRACTIQLDGPMCKQLSALINIDGCVGFIVKPKEKPKLGMKTSLAWHWVGVRREQQGSWCRVDSLPSVPNEQYAGFDECVFDMKKNHDNKIIAIYRRNHPSLASVDSILLNQRKRKRETSDHRQGISISEEDDVSSANVGKKRKMITKERTKQPNASVSSKESTKRSHASMSSKNKNQSKKPRTR